MIFDLQGCVGVRHANAAMLEVVQNYRAILDGFVTLFGGKVYPKKSGDFKWAIYNTEGTKAALLKLLPYLVEKKEQADLVLNMNGDAQEIKGKLRTMKANSTKPTM